MMGDGVIDLRAIRAMVEAAGYRGHCEVEILSANNWWTARSRRGAAHLHRAASDRRLIIPRPRRGQPCGGRSRSGRRRWHALRRPGGRRKMTTMRSASSSNSSRSSLTSSTAAPRLRAATISAWISATAAKSSPKHGIGGDQHVDLAAELARQHRALDVAAGEVADRRIGRAGLDLVARDHALGLRADLLRRLSHQPPAANGARSKSRKREVVGDAHARARRRSSAAPPAGTRACAGASRSRVAR